MGRVSACQQIYKHPAENESVSGGFWPQKPPFCATENMKLTAGSTEALGFMFWVCLVFFKDFSLEKVLLVTYRLPIAMLQGHKAKTTVALEMCICFSGCNLLSAA